MFWRDVPVDPHDLGQTALDCMPTMKQAFLEALAEVDYAGSDRAVYVTVVMPDGSVLLQAVGEADDRFYKSHGQSRFERRSVI